MCVMSYGRELSETAESALASAPRVHNGNARAHSTATTVTRVRLERDLIGSNGLRPRLGRVTTR